MEGGLTCDGDREAAVGEEARGKGGSEWRTKFRNLGRLVAKGFLGRFTAVSAPWVSGQPSERLSVILINNPMNRYLLGDFEADAVDSLLAGPWGWGHFPWMHHPSPWVWNCRSGWVFCRASEHRVVFITLSLQCGRRGWSQCWGGTTASDNSASPMGGTSEWLSFLLSVSSLVFKSCFDILCTNNHPSKPMQWWCGGGGVCSPIPSFYEWGKLSSKRDWHTLLLPTKTWSQN